MAIWRKLGPLTGRSLTDKGEAYGVATSDLLKTDDENVLDSTRPELHWPSSLQASQTRWLLRIPPAWRPDIFVTKLIKINRQSPLQFLISTVNIYCNMFRPAWPPSGNTKYETLERSIKSDKTLNCDWPFTLMYHSGMCRIIIRFLPAVSHGRETCLSFNSRTEILLFRERIDWRIVVRSPAGAIFPYSKPSGVHPASDSLDTGDKATRTWSFHSHLWSADDGN